MKGADKRKVLGLAEVSLFLIYWPRLLSDLLSGTR